jgi:hypothetical protein
MIDAGDAMPLSAIAVASQLHVCPSRFSRRSVRACMASEWRCRLGRDDGVFCFVRGMADGGPRD